jgi:hypothetical protein
LNEKETNVAVHGLRACVELGQSVTVLHKGSVSIRTRERGRKAHRRPKLAMRLLELVLPGRCKIRCIRSELHEEGREGELCEVGAVEAIYERGRGVSGMKEEKRKNEEKNVPRQLTRTTPCCSASSFNLPSPSIEATVAPKLSGTDSTPSPIFFGSRSAFLPSRSFPLIGDHWKDRLSATCGSSSAAVAHNSLYASPSNASAASGPVSMSERRERACTRR